MYNTAKLSDENRKELFQNTAAKKGMNEAVVEKDFWVCLSLDYLFHICKWKEGFAFKGGTSLSKVYNVIERFSEDIDLILDWRILGYSKDEPWEERSNTKQQKFIDDSRNRLFGFLKNEFVPEFRRGISDTMGQDAVVYIDEGDDGIVNFAYPSLFKDKSLLEVIRLELGALAAWTPTQNTEITAYVTEEYPDLFKLKNINVLTTTAERSFWEKATILHQEAMRPEGSMMPARYSRHYYDLYCMAKTPIKENALKDTKLLEDVAAFKNKFYPRKWARYDLAKAGTLELMPASHNIQRLKDDYYKMKSMIYGYYPSYEEMMEEIAKLEDDINGKER